MCPENREPTEGAQRISKQIPPSRIGSLEKSQTRKHRLTLRGFTKTDLEYDEGKMEDKEGRQNENEQKILGD